MQSKAERARAAAGVALLHAALAYAVIAGLGVDVRHVAGETLRVFTVETEPPPPPPVPAEVPRPEPEGAAAPPSEKARPTPVPAPQAPPGCRSWAVPMPGGGACAGSSETPGTGTGAGGEGVGTGAGRGGGGTGGGIAVRARRIAGELRDSDYPGRDRPARVESVGVRFTVTADGDASGCRVTRTSGNPRLDDLTCDLIERRFRYRPAADSAGNPLPSTVDTIFDWIPPALNRR